MHLIVTYVITDGVLLALDVKYFLSITLEN
jgi:hypothetical protein